MILLLLDSGQNTDDSSLLCSGKTFTGDVFVGVLKLLIAFIFF